MNKELIAIFEYLEREKGIKRETILSAIEESLAIAAKKSIKNIGSPKVCIDKKTGEIEILTQKTIVDKVKNPETEISLSKAKLLAENCEIGQRLEISISPKEFGRIAAQTARQVIAQKLKEAEKDVIYKEYRDRMGEIISGKVKRFFKGKNLAVDLGKVEAILLEKNYPKSEKYRIGDKVTALLFEVRDTDSGGAEVILSRSHPQFVSALFQQEVPEIADKTIFIKKIAREPGYRTKILVQSSDPKVDPVGTCVGIRGTRIKNIIRELNNEKIDVIPYSEDKIQLLKDLLAPIEILKYRETENKITIVVSDEDYPVVIGKKGMNVRLLAKLLEKEFLTKKISEYQKLILVRSAEFLDSDSPLLETKIEEIKNISNLILEELISHGFTTVKKVLQSSPEEISKSIAGINYLDLIEKILEIKE